MKNLIKTAKITSLSLLAIISLTAGIMATSSTAQAGPWIALNATVCQPAHLGGDEGDELFYHIYGLINGDLGPGPTSTFVHCPLKLEEVGGNKTVRVWVNYDKRNSNMSCFLYSSDYFGNLTSTSFSLNSGKSSSVKNINSPYGGTIIVSCKLNVTYTNGFDQLYSFNYKIL